MNTAAFSPCRTYRYTLWRQWDDLLNDRRYLMVVGLNPSTADETNDDPTIRRCINFAKAWGFGGLCMTNLFAFRATNPRDMMAASDPIGIQNDQYLLEVAQGAGLILAAWGALGKLNDRDRVVQQMLPPMHCLRTTKDGYPGHPLYLPAYLVPVPYAGRSVVITEGGAA